MSTAAAFNQLASRYDELWTNSAVGRRQREAVWREIDKLFGPGGRVLDLGCGTGEDAAHLASRGVRVDAVDASPAMIDVARRRIAGAELTDHVTTQVLSIESLDRLAKSGPFDGALANFGVLNCVENLERVAARLSRLVKPGGRIALCSMGRSCLWEMIWYLLRAEPSKAFRRFTRGGVPTSLGFPVFYPTAAQIARAFGPYFGLTGARGIGVFVPPSCVRAGAASTGFFAMLDRGLAGLPVARSMGDHQLLTFVRRDHDGEVPEQAAPRLVSSRPASSHAHRLKLLCPACAAALVEETVVEEIRCPGCGFALRNEDGIVRAIPPARRQLYDRFLSEYSAIRQAEGRGSENAAYYRALPYQDLTGRNSAQWAMRAKTFEYFAAHLLPSGRENASLDILDLGAGNGWMSYRLAQRGHRPVAVDIRADALDGLRAAQHYFSEEIQFPRFEAEFDRLPFASAQFDLVIFNASLHYSTDYRRTIEEARRCLRPSGRIVVLDSPVYKRREHGELMREERHRQFETQYGFRSDSIQSMEFLDEPLLAELSRDLGVKWEIHKPWYGWQWHLRPWKARLLGRRPPSRFWILVAKS